MGKIKPEWETDAVKESNDLRKDRDRLYREANPQVGYERLKKWRKQHPEAARELQHRAEQSYRDNNPTKQSRTTEWRKALPDEEADARREKDRLRKQAERARKRALQPPKPPKPKKSKPATPPPAYYPQEALGSVVLLHGTEVDFASAWAHTDADLRERITTQHPSATDQELLDTYCLLHMERYGEPFDF